MISAETVINKLPEDCWHCPFADCKLPYSKVIVDSKLIMYSKNIHPKCNLNSTNTDSEEH